MRIVIATLSILFAASVVTIALMNPERVTVVLWPDMPEYAYANTPISWVIFFSALAGFVFTGIIAVLEGSKTRLSNARLRSQLKRLQQEVEMLRRPSFDFEKMTSPTLGGAGAAIAVSGAEADETDETLEGP